MIELPEAVTIARQLDETIKNKQIIESNTGESSHKWVFYSPSREKLVEILPGQNIKDITSIGRGIHIGLEKNQALVIDEFGGKLHYNEPGTESQKKYHLFLKFEDDSSLSVAIQGWGFISTLAEWKKNEWSFLRANSISPEGDEFSFDRFIDILEQYEDKEKDSVKSFFTNGKSVAGIGNGYLQDILFKVNIHPKRKVIDISEKERIDLHNAIKETLNKAIQLGGRETEYDLYNNPGGYKPILDAHMKGKPCPKCGTAIEKLNVLGSSSYICPSCQK